MILRVDLVDSHRRANLALQEEMLEELATKIENASKPRPEVSQKMHDIGAAQRSGECKNLKPVMANQQAVRIPGTGSNLMSSRGG
jgi:hypothetical protein